MKKSVFLLFGLMLWASTSTFAHNPDYFIGTWDVLISDTPQGNVNVTLILERVEGKLTGKFTQGDSEQGTNITNISEQENGIILYFFAEGYDLYLSLNAAEEDKISGFLVDQFPVKGERVKK
ncbi:cytochrome c [Aquiflexum balticum DSM 16537]|uniref:Cytochrome c n=1 Tax=Aquiflexum balticum DSM 16537 TaxID=758820 RepID=A0A1W2H0B9_9BACT|nr:hypothetical protein [Aquiflexum balticum]SMD42224.1 cytochrome c [Aquiflexum balticum DSM 16537]